MLGARVFGVVDQLRSSSGEKKCLVLYHRTCRLNELVPCLFFPVGGDPGGGNLYSNS